MIKGFFKCVGYYFIFMAALGWMNTQDGTQYGFMVVEYPESGGRYYHYMAKLSYDPSGAIYINGEERHLKKRGDVYNQFGARSSDFFLTNEGSIGIHYKFNQYEPFRHKVSFSAYNWRQLPFTALIIPFLMYDDYKKELS